MLSGFFFCNVYNTVEEGKRIYGVTAKPDVVSLEEQSPGVGLLSFCLFPRPAGLGLSYVDSHQTHRMFTELVAILLKLDGYLGYLLTFSPHPMITVELLLLT